MSPGRNGLRSPSASRAPSPEIAMKISYSWCECASVAFPGATTHQAPSNGALRASHGTSRWTLTPYSSGMPARSSLRISIDYSRSQARVRRSRPGQALRLLAVGEQVVDDLAGPHGQHADERVRHAVRGLVGSLQVAAGRDVRRGDHPVVPADPDVADAARIREVADQAGHPRLETRAEQHQVAAELVAAGPHPVVEGQHDLAVGH